MVYDIETNTRSDRCEYWFQYRRPSVRDLWCVSKISRLPKSQGEKVTFIEQINGARRKLKSTILDNEPTPKIGQFLEWVRYQEWWTSIFGVLR